MPIVTPIRILIEDILMEIITNRTLQQLVNEVFDHRIFDKIYAQVNNPLHSQEIIEQMLVNQFDLAQEDLHT
jgi:flagellar basal body-associated protein FliL